MFVCCKAPPVEDIFLALNKGQPFFCERPPHGDKQCPITAMMFVVVDVVVVVVGMVVGVLLFVVAVAAVGIVVGVVVC